MPATVYFADLKADEKKGLMDKINLLIKRVGLKERLSPSGLTAIKLHFGEKGNTSFIRPVYVRRVVEAVKAAKAEPFLTDCNTLYVGERSQSVGHLETAIQNGFAYSVAGAPLIIADGLKGASYREVQVGLPDCQTAYIGSDIVEAEAIVSLAHFKGHELSGFGGTIKNLGMGCASRRGKLFQHSDVTPEVKADLCIACGACLKRCPTGAIRLAKRMAGDPPAPKKSKKPELRAFKNPKKCIGCGDCILTCPQKAMSINWNAQVPVFMRRMVAYTKAVLAGKQDRAVFFNFLMQISPACDCYPFQDAPVVPDLGVLASLDPVAIDQAGADLVNQAPGLVGSCLKSAHAPGADKFRDIYPKVDWTIQLAYAEKIGLGQREYKLIRV